MPTEADNPVQSRIRLIAYMGWEILAERNSDENTNFWICMTDFGVLRLSKLIPEIETFPHAHGIEAKVLVRIES